MNSESWEFIIARERQAKDHYFAHSDGSPLTDEQKSAFGGLHYYRLDEALRYQLELHEHAVKREIKIPDSAGVDRVFICWGEFRFNVSGKECVLQAYRMPDQETIDLFIPFKDTTSGLETYPMGRYIDLDENDLSDDGKWELDFNLAYSPFCAYSDRFACALIPTENNLQVATKAGEKLAESEKKKEVMNFEDEVTKAISQVKHPAINATLVDLGLITKIEVIDKLVKVEFSLPFAKIPVLDFLINSIRQPVTRLGFELETSTREMSEKEREAFFVKERANWMGLK